MAISGFGRGKGGDPVQGASPAPETGTSGEGMNITAYFAEGLQFEGTVRFNDTVRIDGEIKGEIVSENTVVVGETGAIEAAIRSKNVIIGGAVAGDVVASRQLVLKGSARLKGNVETPSLVVEKGAVFNGRMKMVRPEMQAQAKARRQARTEERAETPARDAAKARDRRAPAPPPAGPSSQIQGV